MNSSTREFLKTNNNHVVNIEDRFLQMFEADRTVAALSSVINYIITDAFDLTPEDSIWIGRLLNSALEPLKTIVPTATLGAVKQEMTHGTYSIRMFAKANTPTGGQNITTQANTINKNIEYASASDWTEGICEIILAGYPHLRPTIHSRIIGSIYGIFTELNVGENPETSRASTYLPDNIRYLLRNG